WSARALTDGSADAAGHTTTTALVRAADGKRVWSPAAPRASSAAPATTATPTAKSHAAPAAPTAPQSHVPPTAPPAANAATPNPALLLAANRPANLRLMPARTEASL